MRKFFCLLSIFILTGCINTSTNLIWELDTTIEYTGPYLDDSYFEIESLSIDELGSGKAFEVTLNYVVDGDTARFNTPYDSIYTSSFRFFNIDTKETSSSNQEEWGKPATMFTKEILENAYSIVLQTDIGDAITDNYNRGLVWVWVKDNQNSDYQLLNYRLTQAGLATVRYLYGAGEKMYYNDKSYLDYLYEAESYSKEHNLGIYSNLIDPYWDYENNIIK